MAASNFFMVASIGSGTWPSPAELPARRKGTRRANPRSRDLLSDEKSDIQILLFHRRMQDPAIVDSLATDPVKTRRASGNSSGGTVKMSGEKNARPAGRPGFRSPVS